MTVYVIADIKVTDGGWIPDEFEYGSSLRLLAMTSRRVAHRQEIRERSPADCGGRRHSCGRWASRLHSLAKAEQERE
jgi:hypothetical protein